MAPDYRSMLMQTDDGETFSLDLPSEADVQQLNRQMEEEGVPDLVESDIDLSDKELSLCHCEPITDCCFVGPTKWFSVDEKGALLVQECSSSTTQAAPQRVLIDFQDQATKGFKKIVQLQVPITTTTDTGTTTSQCDPCVCARARAHVGVCECGSPNVSHGAA